MPSSPFLLSGILGFHRSYVPIGNYIIIITVDLFENSKIVIPAKAGIQTAGIFYWIPTYVGITVSEQEYVNPHSQKFSKN